MTMPFELNVVVDLSRHIHETLPSHVHGTGQQAHEERGGSAMQLAAEHVNSTVRDDLLTVQCLHSVISSDLLVIISKRDRRNSFSPRIW
jgi:hypothetical protein